MQVGWGLRQEEALMWAGERTTGPISESTVCSPEAEPSRETPTPTPPQCLDGEEEQGLLGGPLFRVPWWVLCTRFRTLRQLKRGWAFIFLHHYWASATRWVTVPAKGPGERLYLHGNKHPLRGLLIIQRPAPHPSESLIPIVSGAPCNLHFKQASPQTPHAHTPPGDPVTGRFSEKHWPGFEAPPKHRKDIIFKVKYP